MNADFLYLTGLLRHSSLEIIMRVYHVSGCIDSLLTRTPGGYVCRTDGNLTRMPLDTYVAQIERIFLPCLTSIFRLVCMIEYYNNNLLATLYYHVD